MRSLSHFVRDRFYPGAAGAVWVVQMSKLGSLPVRAWLQSGLSTVIRKLDVLCAGRQTFDSGRAQMTL